MPVYITRKGLELACHFEPDQPAVLSAELFMRINYEGYFFCNASELQRFGADPISFCGMLTDPVSKLRFRPSSESPRAHHEGVLYYFEGGLTAGLFAKAPDDYMLPGYKMMDDDEASASPEESQEASSG